MASAAAAGVSADRLSIPAWASRSTGRTGTFRISSFTGANSGHWNILDSGIGHPRPQPELEYDQNPDELTVIRSVTFTVQSQRLG